MKITTIQFFDQTFTRPVSEFEDETIRQYSVNIAIDDKFIVQLSGNDEECNWSIPAPSEMCWNGEEGQSWACDNVDIDDIKAFLKEEGIENNFDFLDEHADEHY